MIISICDISCHFSYFSIVFCCSPQQRDNLMVIGASQPTAKLTPSNDDDTKKDPPWSYKNKYIISNMMHHDVPLALCTIIIRFASQRLGIVCCVTFFNIYNIYIPYICSSGNDSLLIYWTLRRIIRAFFRVFFLCLRWIRGSNDETLLRLRFSIYIHDVDTVYTTCFAMMCKTTLLFSFFKFDVSIGWSSARPAKLLP